MLVVEIGIVVVLIILNGLLAMSWPLFHLARFVSGEWLL